MNYFISAIKQTTKFFASSILCSVIFVNLLQSTYSKPLIGFVLLLTSVILFSFICNRIFYSLYFRTQYISEYLYSSIFSLIIYIIAAAILYHFRLSSVYNWFFLPTRFLEPLMKILTIFSSIKNKEIISYVVFYAIVLIIIIRIPIKQYFYMRNNNFTDIDD